MTSDLVTVNRHGGVAVLTLNAPERRNALSSDMVRTIGEAYDSLERDDSVRCVVLTGQGSGFCAGAELATLRAAYDGDFGTVKNVYDGFLKVLNSPLPTIAAINGPAVGAGFNLALACDVRLAGKKATFDTRFVQLRIHPGGGHAWLLARAVGQQRAALACMFGEVWDAQTAQEAGLIARVIEDDELVDQAIELGRRLDHLEPEFVRHLTATLRQSLTIVEHSEALALETKAQQWSTTRPDFRTGVREIEDRILSAKANR